MKDKNSIQQGYKNSVVGIIPDEWEVTTLGNLVFITSGESPSIYRLEEQGKYPYIKVEDMNNCEKFQFFSREYSNDVRSLIQKGSIIFPKRGAAILNNKVRIAGCEIYMDSNMMAITPRKDVCGDYLYFKIIYEKLFKIADTSTIPQINNKHIIPYKLALPPLAEQKKIAEILCTWDDAIENQSKLIEKLELRKRGLMQRLLTGKTRLHGFTEPWKNIKLGEIGSTYTGLSGKTKSDFENGNAKFISYVNVFSNEKVNINDFGTVKVNSNEKQNIVRYGDIFFTVSSETPNEVGMSSVLLDAVENTYLNSFCFGYRLNDFSVLEPVFASYILRTDKFRSSIILLAQGSTRFNLSKNEVMKLQIKLPLLAEQKAIAAVLTFADKEIEKQRKKLEVLRQQKRGLMQQLLTGKTRVTI